MRLELRNENRIIVCNLPAREKKIHEICQELNIENDIYSKVRVSSVEFEDNLNHLIGGKEYTLDELNFFMKRFDSLAQHEKNTVYAVADGLKHETMKDLINLTYNTHCYHLVDNFKDINGLGESLYLNEKIGLSLEEIEAVDFSEYVENILRNPKPIFTKYGLVYENENSPTIEYNGKQLPHFQHGQNPITLCLNTKLDRDFLYLPVEEHEVKKALQRLGVENKGDVGIEVEYHNLMDNMAEIILKEPWKVEKINEVAKQLQEIGERDYNYISDLMAFTQVDTLEEVSTLLSTAYEFEIFVGVETPEEYGKYMICTSGRFEYDENLEEFIDFEKYGNHKIYHETGAFTEEGYIIYHGYDEKMQEILNKKIGVEIKMPQELQELRIYMPLNAKTYYEENDYGDLYQVDYEIDVYASELVAFEEEISEAIKSRRLLTESDRGLMEYFDGSRTVNAKVRSFNYEVEEVNGELMGVAVLTVAGELDYKELAEIKDYITGQSSDGFGEGLEQQGIRCNGKEIYVSLWDSKNWSLKTEEEMGFKQQRMGGMSL